MKIKKIFKNLSFILCPAFFVLCVLLGSIYSGADGKTISGMPGSIEGLEIQSESKISIQDENREIRAVWVPYMDISSYLSIDEFGESEKFRNKVQEMVATAKKYKINTLIIHARSHSDSIYPSKLFPWSRFLIKFQGENPGFDPLKIIIEEAHEENIQVQAWINPFRIQSESEEKINLASEPNCVIKCESGVYYNPASDKVQELIVNGIKEVVKNYDVDAIHFDDRFYPTESEDFDKDSYNQYLCKIGKESDKLDIYKWRQKNVNELIEKIYKEIKSIKSGVMFGIAPEGNINNCEKHGVDVKTWCSRPGYVDYICPQLYWSLDNPALDFKTAANSWKDILKSSDIKLYFGLSLYKIGTNCDQDTWNSSDGDILKREIEYSRSIGCKGFMLYPYGCLKKEETQKELLNVAKTFS